MERWIAFWVGFLLLGTGGVVPRDEEGPLPFGEEDTQKQAEQYNGQPYDKEALCRFMGKLMFAIGGCYCLIALSTFLECMALTWVGLALIAGLVLWAVIYANTGNRFRKGK